jgi:predicted membrane chloride channel (bestrophin family)
VYDSLLHPSCSEFFVDGIHLKQCVTLYLFALPLTLVHDLSWFSIPVTTIVAFMFMGIEGIADEIEMPFGMVFPHFVLLAKLTLNELGNDPSDLPLGMFVYCTFKLS